MRGLLLGAWFCARCTTTVLSQTFEAPDLIDISTHLSSSPFQGHALLRNECITNGTELFVLPQSQAVERLASSGWQITNTTGAGHIILRRHDQVLKFVHSVSERFEHREGYTEYIALQYVQAAWTASALESIALWTTRPGYLPSPSPVCFQASTDAGSGVFMLGSSFIPGLPFSMAVSHLRTADEALALVGSMLKVLAFLRSVGMVHRDIDSRNVIVNGTDVYLIDFSHAVWPGRPAAGAVPRGLGLHRPPDWLTCGFDDFYSAGAMLRQALRTVSLRLGLGVQQVIYHMTRQRCQDRIRDVTVLMGMLDQYGRVHELPAPCYVSHSAELFSLTQPTDGCRTIFGPHAFRVCGSRIDMQLGTNDKSLAYWGGHPTRTLVSRLTVLELGDDAGFIGINALLHSAIRVNILGASSSAVTVGTALAQDLNIALAYVAEPVPADVVMASLTGVEWLSCHHSLGTVTEVVDMLARYAGRYLILEWLDYSTDALMLGNLHVTGDTARSLLRDMRSAFAGYRCSKREDASSSRFLIVAAARSDDVAALDELGMQPC